MQALSEVVQEHSSLLHLGVDERKKFCSVGQWPVWPENWIKYHPTFEKVTQKYQNIYTKAEFESLKPKYQTTFETSTYPQQTMNSNCLFT